MMNPLSNLPAPQPAEPQGSVSAAPAPSDQKSFENMLSGGPKGKTANAGPREGAQPAKSAASSPRAAGVSGKESATSAGRGEPDAELSASVELEKDGTTQLNDSAEEGEEVDREQNLGDPTLEALLMGIPLSVPPPKPEPTTVSWSESGPVGEDSGSLALNGGGLGQESIEVSPRGNQNRESQPTGQFFQRPAGFGTEAPAEFMKQPLQNAGLNLESNEPGGPLAVPAEDGTAQNATGLSNAMSSASGQPQGAAAAPGASVPAQIPNVTQPVPEGIVPQAAESPLPIFQTGAEASPVGQTIQQTLAQGAPRVQEGSLTGAQETGIKRPGNGIAQRGVGATPSDKPLFQSGLGKALDAEEPLRGPDSIAGMSAPGKDAQTAVAEEEETGSSDALQSARKPGGMATAMQESAMQKPASNRSNSSKAAAFAASENSASVGTEFFPQSTAFPGQPVGPGLQSQGKAAEVSRQEMTSIVNQAVDAAQRIKATGPESVEVKLQLESGETLSIQLQLTRGEVKPVFRAESESLRIALEQNWAQFSNRAEERGVRLASAVFESQPSSLGMNDQPGRQSGRERGEAGNPQENLPSQTPLRRTPAPAKSSATLRPSAGVQLYA